MEAVLKRISEIGIIPVVKLDCPHHAVPLAKALKRGGIPIAEITFRTQAARESIQRIREECPDILLGAGTITMPEQAQEAVKAGASFLVTPGVNKGVIEQAQNLGTAVIPGVASATEIEMAMALGLSVLKFFPAEQMGGIATIKALSAPYQQVCFIPTGGISEKNINEYLACSKVLACGGSWMVKEELIHAGNYDAIEQLARNAIAKVMGFSLAHVGINCQDDIQASEMAGMFKKLFDFHIDERSTSIFAGMGIECIKQPSFGVNGHIGIATNDIERAALYLKRNGIALRMDQVKRDANGKYSVVYLQDEIGGFAIHLMQK